MGINLSSFGSAISSARKQLGMSQKELAGKIKKEDGEPITPQYLNDIEHDRRKPQSDHLVNEFARVLKIDPLGLFGAVGILPEHDRKLVKKASPDQVKDAFVAFRKSLTR